MEPLLVLLIVGIFCGAEAVLWVLAACFVLAVLGVLFLVLAALLAGAPPAAIWTGGLIAAAVALLIWDVSRF